jgi:hypothetical protein
MKIANLAVFFLCGIFALSQVVKADGPPPPTTKQKRAQAKLAQRQHAHERREGETLEKEWKKDKKKKPHSGGAQPSSESSKQ